MSTVNPVSFSFLLKAIASKGLPCKKMKEVVESLLSGRFSSEYLVGYGRLAL